MDEAKLQEIEARANVATAWVPDECELEVDPEDGYVYAPQGATLGQTLITLGDTYEGSGEDWSFVAHARTDVPDLVAEVRRLTAALAIVRGDLGDTNALADGYIARLRAEHAAALATARREGAEEMRERAKSALREWVIAGRRGKHASTDTLEAVDMIAALPLDAPGGAT